MKAAKFSAFVLCVLFFVFALQAQAKEIPGGVAYSTGSDLIYYDFATKRRKSMIANWEEITINGPFSVSENGQKLIFSLNDDKIYMRRIPMGKTIATKFHDIKLYDPLIEEFIKKGIILKIQWRLRNLSLSPNGISFSCETEEMDRSFVRVPPIERYQGPTYTEKPDTCNTIWWVNWANIGRESSTNDTNAVVVGPSVGGYWGKFGNVAKYFEGRLMEYGHGVGFTHLEASGITLTVPDAIQRFSIKRNAHFGAWSKAEFLKDQLFAVIYQTANGWGPIEIRDSTVPVFYKKGKTDYAGKKPGVYEIPVKLKNCHGLAWKPDGSLTYVSEKGVFCLDAKQIAQGIQNSSLARNPDTRDPDTRDPDSAILLAIPVAVNNIFVIHPAPVVEGVMGTKLHWIDNDSFLVRGFDKGIYYWDKEGVKKITPNSPEEFSYVNNLSSDFDFSSSAPDSTGRPRYLQGRGETWTDFYIGSLLLYCSPAVARVFGQANFEKYFYLNLNLESLSPGQDSLEFCILQGVSLKSITDPAACKFSQTKFPKLDPNENGRMVKIGSDTMEERGPVFIRGWQGKPELITIRCAVNDTVLLKLGNTCAGMEVTNIQVTKWSEMKLLDGSSINVTEKGIVKYEWKFWPDLGPTVVAKKATQNK